MCHLWLPLQLSTGDAMERSSDDVGPSHDRLVGWAFSCACGPPVIPGAGDRNVLTFYLFGLNEFIEDLKLGAESDEFVARLDLGAVFAHKAQSSGAIASRPPPR
jgi:hypothetical protein